MSKDDNIIEFPNRMSPEDELDRVIEQFIKDCEEYEKMCMRIEIAEAVKPPPTVEEREQEYLKQRELDEVMLAKINETMEREIRYIGRLMIATMVGLVIAGALILAQVM